VVKSAYKRIIHKEERDIVHQPLHSFKQAFDEYGDNLKKLKGIINKIHIANYQSKVNFREE